jgi:S-adenosylmethionine-dependent methyltransferase
VWDALLPLLAGDALDVVDLGGGTGGLAVAMAERGHRVTVVDPSPDALAALDSRAAQAGVTTLVDGVIGDAATLADVVGSAVADLVVCHDVLEVVDLPLPALRAAAEVLRPDGRLSVLAHQRSGAVVARALAGQLDQALDLLAAGPDRLPRRFGRSELEGLVVAAGFAVVEVRGVRVFTDIRITDPQPGADVRLAALETAVEVDPDFLPLAAQLHLLAVKETVVRR